jgi:EmrB/QacA subfamily drug resistance transporter
MTPTLTPTDVRWILTGTMLAMFLAALEQTIIATALPPIAADLGGFDQMSWVVTAYLLSATCTTPVVGKLSDIYGRRQMFALAIVVFLIGSALCALAPSMGWLIFGRVVQGIGGGGVMTMSQATVADVVPPRERGRYTAWFAIVWAISGVMGPILGGVISASVGWPWIFWINLPFGLVALVMIDRVMRRLAHTRRRVPIDYGGILLLIAATVAALWVLSTARTATDWTSVTSLALMAAAAVGYALFWRWQIRSPDPIIPPRFLADRALAPVLAASFVIYGTYVAVAVLMPVYLQIGLGAPVQEAGLLMIMLLVPSTITAAAAGKWARRTGRYKMPPLVGLAVAAAALSGLAFGADGATPTGTAIWLGLIGLGLGPFFPMSMLAVQNAVTQSDVGAASGTVTFSRSLGAAVLTAGVTSLLLATITAALPEIGAVSSLEELAHRDLPATARAVVAGAFVPMLHACAGALVVGAAIFALAEERILRGAAPAPSAD